MSSKTNGKHKSGGSIKRSRVGVQARRKDLVQFAEKDKIMIFFNIDLSVENKLNDSDSP